jgi:hypothetical protein
MSQFEAALAENGTIVALWSDNKPIGDASIRCNNHRLWVLTGSRAFSLDFILTIVARVAGSIVAA